MTTTTENKKIEFFPALIERHNLTGNFKINTNSECAKYFNLNTSRNKLLFLQYIVCAFAKGTVSYATQHTHSWMCCVTLHPFLFIYSFVFIIRSYLLVVSWLSPFMLCSSLSLLEYHCFKFPMCVCIQDPDYLTWIDFVFIFSKFALD